MSWGMQLEQPNVQAINQDRSGYHDIIVHLDGSEDDETRLAHAEMLAGHFGARLTGLFTNPLPEAPLYFYEGLNTKGFDLDAEVRQAGAKVYQRLAERFEKIAVPTELKLIEEMSNFLCGEFAREALWSDLVVASCPYEPGGAGRWDRLVEAVLFDGAHGIYLVPRKVQPRSAIRTVLICWNERKEAARAISAAMPLLTEATQVHLVCVNNVDTVRLARPESMADIARYLSHRGIQTNISVIKEENGVAASLLNEAHRVSADLIVMGAYGHSRLREWFVGGATVDIIKNTDLPLLLAN